MFKTHRLLIAAALAFSAGATAHSQLPTEYKKFVVQKRVLVPIEVTNINDFNQSYDLFVDDVRVGRLALKSGETRKVKVPVSADTANRWVRHEIHTRSIPRKGEKLITRIFTKVKLYRLTPKKTEYHES